MLHQWCIMMFLYFPIKKKLLQIGWSQDPFRTWGRVRVDASFGWNLSKVSQHQMELITNKNGKLNGEHERWNHGMFMFSIVSHHILTNHGTHGKCIVGNRVFHSFPMQTSWNHARMTERFVVNGSFVVRIILKLVKRLFELKIWPISLPFQVQPVSAHFRLCGISASMFFEDWFLSVFPWVFPWIFDQATHPDTDLVHRKFHMKIRTLRIKPRSRLGLRWLFWPMRKWGFHSEK